MYSQGVPRLINLLCDTALVYGFAEQKSKIDAKIVIDVAKDKQKGGIFPMHGKEKNSDDLAGADAAIIAEFTSKIAQERAAEDAGLAEHGTVGTITENEIGLLNYLKN